MKKIFTLLALFCVAMGINAQTYELSPSTYKSADSLFVQGEEKIDTFVVWNFTSNGKDFTIKCQKGWATGSGTTKGTMKLSRNHNFEVSLPEGVTINAVRVTGWTNIDEKEGAIKATVQINGVNDTNELPFRTTSTGADFTINTESPLTESFIFRVNDNQACVKLYLLTEAGGEEGGGEEEDDNKTYDTTATYALAADEAHEAGEVVSVTDANGNEIATVTYGVKDEAAYNAAVADSHVTGFAAYTTGNGVNGTADGSKGTLYTITPKYDGKVAAAVVLNANKSFYVLEDGVPLSKYNGITADAKYYGTYEFSVKAGKVYTITAAGTKLGFYGFNYSYNAGGDTPTPTPSGYDLNGDGSVNVTDVMTLIQYVLDHMGQ